MTPDLSCLKHMLGISNKNKKLHGSRNYFWASENTPDHKNMLQLKAMGLVKEGYSGDGMVCFFATEAGCVEAGLGPAAIDRALGRDVKKDKYKELLEAVKKWAKAQDEESGEATAAAELRKVAGIRAAR